MSAGVLREAAAMMRGRAQNVALTEWHFTDSAEERYSGYDVWTHDGETHWTVATSDYADSAEHIASWHPAVALAVADWLDATVSAGARHLAGLSGCKERDNSRKPNAQGLCPLCSALAVARAYLGRDA